MAARQWRARQELSVELVELDDPLDARAPPGVQALVLVADAQEQVLGRRDHLDEQFLRRLDVLVLVDKDGRVLTLPVCRRDFDGR